MRTRTPGTAVPPAAVSPSPSTDLKRRRFLLSLGAGGATAAAATVATLPGATAVIEADAQDNTGGTGYRDTEHVRDYYRTART
jgi:hypothetical protein